MESQKGSILKHLKKGIAIEDYVNETKKEETGNCEIGHMVALDPIRGTSSAFTGAVEHEPVEDNEIETIENETETVQELQDDKTETFDWCDIGCWTLNF